MHCKKSISNENNGSVSANMPIDKKEKDNCESSNTTQLHPIKIILDRSLFTSLLRHDCPAPYTVLVVFLQTTVVPLHLAPLVHQTVLEMLSVDLYTRKPVVPSNTTLNKPPTSFNNNKALAQVSYIIMRLVALVEMLALEVHYNNSSKPNSKPKLSNNKKLCRDYSSHFHSADPSHKATRFLELLHWARADSNLY